MVEVQLTVSTDEGFSRSGLEGKALLRPLL